MSPASLRPRELHADVAVPAGCELAEGPVWDADRQLLLWVDILPGDVHAVDPATGTRSQFSVGVPVGAVGLTTGGLTTGGLTAGGLATGGGLVLAVVDGFARCDADGQHLTRLPGPATNPAAVRFNDGKPDPWGGFCAGTMRWRNGTEPGSLYRLGPDGTVTELVTGVGVSNGLDWTDDRRGFYYVDSPSGGVDLFAADPDTGALSGRRRFADIPGQLGCADGLTIDAEGAIWVAVWGAGEVRRYLADGRLEAVVRLPASQVSSVAFGGTDLGTLFITSAHEDFTPAQLRAEPHAGDIFCCAPGVTGRLPFRYAGPA
jgi:sugar lactone lactonase YvrE